MTEKDKELVLIDLCARFPYGINVEITWQYSEFDKHSDIEYYEFPNIDDLLKIFWDEKCISVKPYLRPMSSMTEEEVNEYNELCTCNVPFPGIVEKSVADFMDWLNSHHFDYRGLIEKGLALEAPKDMYN